MNTTAFVVLHYETVNDTEECVKSLIKFIDLNKSYVIVVDNGSSIGRLDSLKLKYELNESIIFIRSEQNLGFANGNNLGFIYAKEKLNAKFIILTNSDTIFKQKDFVSILEKSYKEKPFDVAGPKIISMIDKKNQNPVKKMYNNYKEVEKRLRKFQILRLLSLFNIDVLIQNFFKKEVESFTEGLDEDFQLHGACLIFAQNYIEMYSGLYDKTFMYGEESILKYMLDYNKMRMAYIDDLVMYHKEGSSTESIYGKGKKKRQFYYKWNIESCKILADLMKNSNF
jgi:GT2 family glycosyltransferase